MAYASLVSAPSSIPLVNGDAGIDAIGTPVYASAASTFASAQATTSAKARCIGLLAQDQVPPGQLGNVLSFGALVLTTQQWDAICGTSGGLAAGAFYYLSVAAPGQLTSVAPTTPGQYVTLVGEAFSPTILNVNIAPPILL
jgi:hypothetical protein